MCFLVLALIGPYSNTLFRAVLAKDALYSLIAKYPPAHPLAAVIPIGLATHFLVFPPTHRVTIVRVIGVWIGNAIAVGTTEELLFRSVLFRGLAARLPKRLWWVALLLSSLMFGLWHW